MAIVVTVITVALYAFVVLIFVRVIISWASPYPRHYGRSRGWRLVGTVSRFAFLVTEPLLAPIRRLIPPVSGLDLSPLVLTLAIYFALAALRSIGG